MERRNVIIDCDPGIDDSLALMLALASPELRVLGITTVCGKCAGGAGSGECPEGAQAEWGAWIFRFIRERRSLWRGNT